jgi:hypothetical protein
VEKKSDPLKASGTIVRVSSVSSRYSLSFADPYQLEDVTVVDLSDGLAYNSLVRMGVQKMKK